MKTIFVVTSGSYSDYGIDAIFETRELAQLFIDAFEPDSYDGMSIEEWHLNPNEKELQPNKKAFRVRMDINGNASEVEWSNSAYGFKENLGDGVSFTYDKKSMNCYCFATDEKHAIKIANERRVQYIALNRWGVSPS